MRMRIQIVQYLVSNKRKIICFLSILFIDQYSFVLVEINLENFRTIYMPFVMRYFLLISWCFVGSLFMLVI